MPVLRPSGSDFTSFVKAAAQYVPAGRAAKVSKSGGVSVALPGLGAIVRTSQVGALASPTTSAVVINGITPPPAGGGGPPPPTGIPTTVPELQLWLDGADPAGTGTAPSDGAIVSMWMDKSGRNNHGTSHGNPTFVASAFNSKPGISLNGSTQRFVGAITNTGTTVSVFAIVSMNSGGQWGRICSLATTSSADGGVSSLYFIPLIRSFTNQAIQSGRYQGSGNVNTTQVAVTYNTPFQATSVVDGTTNTLYLNGTSAATASCTGNFGYTAYGIGAAPAFPAEWLQGYISEIIIYNASLTSTQRQKIEGYLAWKWGVQASLPAGHPFKTAAPTA